MICLKCGINQISIVHLFYGFLPPKVSVGFPLSVSIMLANNYYNMAMLSSVSNLLETKYEPCQEKTNNVVS